MKRFCLFFCLMVFLCSGRADDLVLKSGKIYKNFRFYKVDASGLAVTHEYGAATIPFSDLPDSLREKYSEQEKKFEAEKQARAEARRKQRETETHKPETNAIPAEEPKKPLSKTETAGIAEKKYWQTAGTKKVHNASCRYYRKSSGEMVSGLNGGTNCKICGGTGSGPFERQTTPAKSNETPGYTGPNTIHVGPRGGRYYINSHGKKTYIRRKK